jgi:hypothetical protein
MSVPTLSSTWSGVSGTQLTAALLEWPPDLFAATNVILDRGEAFRFALSPLGPWPPDRIPGWPEVVEETGRRWSALMDEQGDDVPELVRTEWSVVEEAAESSLDDLAQGIDWRLCEALLTLHAIADEACAGLGVALDASNAGGCSYRARGRELLAHTGSIARLDPGLLRVMPKVRTPPTGRPAFSRYACVPRPGIAPAWHKMPTRHRGTDPTSERASLLLLPWPLQVRESDFRTLEDSVQRLTDDPYGFFEFAPRDGLDFDLVDRVLVAAREETHGVDVVVLPESAVDESELDELEELLDRHGVTFLHTGVRQQAPAPGRFPSNWFHIGVSPSFEKGAEPTDDRTEWFHLRQNKHHRWSLDRDQIYQYHLGGVLHPDIRWWEAMEVPRREVQFLEVAELTLACLVCEDLALNSDIADLIQSVGPTCVITVLLDGPQLTSRWAARYASVLADDPGSAVLTLTSYGMAQRSRPEGQQPSPVIALWKDPRRGVREIPLEPGAHGVLLSICMDRTTRRSADGRWPVDNGTHAFDVAIQQICAADAGSPTGGASHAVKAAPALEPREVTIFTAWAEAVAEVLALAPERAASVLADAATDAGWRSALGLPEPSARLSDAIEALRQTVGAAQGQGGATPFDALLARCIREPPGEEAFDRLVRQVLLSMLEQRRTREPTTAPR